MLSMIPLLFAFGLVILGVFMALAAFSSWEYALRIKKKGQPATATVAELDRSFGGVRPVFAFEDQEGLRTVGMAKNVKRGRNTLFRLGDKVGIYYMANDPGTFILDSRLQPILSWAGMLIGAALCIAGICFLIGG